MFFGFADGGEVLRREAPVNHYGAVEFVQCIDERGRSSSCVEQGVPCACKSMTVEDAVFLHIEVEEPFFLCEPVAEVGFPRSWDAGDKEVHGVSLAFSC
jgi:hypothetical protein